MASISPPPPYCIVYILYSEEKEKEMAQNTKLKLKIAKSKQNINLYIFERDEFCTYKKDRKSSNIFLAKKDHVDLFLE